MESQKAYRSYIGCWLVWCGHPGQLCQAFRVYLSLRMVPNHARPGCMMQASPLVLGRAKRVALFFTPPPPVRLRLYSHSSVRYAHSSSSWRWGGGLSSHMRGAVAHPLPPPTPPLSRFVAAEPCPWRQQADRHSDRHSDSQTVSQTDSQTVSQTDRQSDRRSDSQTVRQ